MMDLESLIELASRHFSAHESAQLVRPLERLVLLQQCAPSALEQSLYEPVMCLILRGEKQVVIGGETHSFAAGECLLVSHDLPVASRVTVAPYWALVFHIASSTLLELRDELDASTLDGHRSAALVQDVDAKLLDALGRYLALAESPADARVVGPLVAREIHYRLLTAPFGGMLRDLAQHDSNASAIARAIGHIRGDIRSAFVVPELARRVGMSPSSFHKQFKAITSTTPLQYQKELRLLEARRRLGSGGANVSSVAFEVGYESLSQFSREYARKFGVPPSRDTRG